MQVVFHNVSDIVGPMTSDHVCSFSLSPLLKAEDGDTVAFYRVTNPAPHEFTNCVQVDPDAMPADGKRGSVTFGADNVPRQEDFYQFQYVRDGTQVLGASIPFQRRLADSSRTPASIRSSIIADGAPKSDEDFMLVKSLDSEKRQRDRVEDMEKQYAELLAVSEKLNGELASRSESFTALEAKYRSLVGADERAQQLKVDLKELLDSKIAAEHQHQKTKEENRALKDKLSKALLNHDELRCMVQKQDAEIKKGREESKEDAKSFADMKQTVGELSKAQVAFNKALDLGPNATVKLRSYRIHFCQHSLHIADGGGS